MATQPQKKQAEFATEREYREDVDSTAAELFDNAKENHPDDKDALRDEAFEAIHEAVDGSQWVIYTARAMRVLMYSRNDDAIFEQGEGLGHVSSMAEVYSQAAFWAFYQDVSEKLDEYIDEYEPAEEEEEEEEETTEEA